jgi:hypothetical protein
LIFAANDYKTEWQGLSSYLIDFFRRKRVARCRSIAAIFMEHGQERDAGWQPDTLCVNIHFVSTVPEIPV